LSVSATSGSLNAGSVSATSGPLNAGSVSATSESLNAGIAFYGIDLLSMLNRI